MKKTEDQRAKIGPLLLCLAGVCWLGGCSWYGPSALEQDYGNSVRNNVAQSILNPRAGLNDTPAVGLSPTAAVNEKEHYDKTFKGDEKRPAEMKILITRQAAMRREDRGNNYGVRAQPGWQEAEGTPGAVACFWSWPRWRGALLGADAVPWFKSASRTESDRRLWKLRGCCRTPIIVDAAGGP
jgi:hypothetical protein